MSNFELNNIQNPEQIIKFIEVGFLPEVSSDENQLADSNEVFLAQLDVAISVLHKLNDLLSKLLNNDLNLQIKPCDILHSCLYLCGEHCQSNFQWSNTESHSIMNECIDKLCCLMHYSNIDELFAHTDVSKLFAGMLYKLKNDNWKKYPAAVECFMWILKYLKVIKHTYALK